MPDDGTYGGDDRPDDERAVRMTFRYADGAVEVDDVQRVRRWVPPGEPLEDRTDRSGFWVELRDADGAVLIRRDLPPTLGDDYEVFPEDPAGEIVRRPVAARAVAFSVVVPEDRQARAVTVMGSPPAAARRREAAGDLATFDFGALLRRAERRE
ncbi:MAG: hypothetical protein ACRDKW_12805 [Actinomycetota bacterium]